jgi:DNA-binding response OmpR family regulator
MNLLVVEDDEDLVELLEFVLTRAGFAVQYAHDITTADHLLTTAEPDLVILDIVIRSRNGLDWLKQIRQHSQIPVILLTGQTAEDCRISAFELGADDYMTKPFYHRELVARIRAVLRRQTGRREVVDPPATLQVGPLRLNPAEYTVYMNENRLSVTVTEFRLLHYLMTHASTVVPTHTLLKHVWGYESTNDTDIVRVNLHRLRRKLGETAQQPQLLHTIPGVGVLLKPGPLVYPEPADEQPVAPAAVADLMT